ncbi:MAG: MMOB1660 family gliding motility ATPase complex subunit [Metamycoplasmataceae bacterium]
MAKEKQYRITSIKDNIVTINGENKFRFLEQITFVNKTKGVVLKANHLEAKVALVDVNDENPLKIGDLASSNEEVFSIDIWNSFFGTIIDVFGNRIHKNEFIEAKGIKPEIIGNKNVFEEAKPIYGRLEVKDYLPTGTTAIDGILPIGKGQRELIIGDRGTGKTSIAITALLAQKNNDVKNIYVSIGKKREEVLEIKNILKERGVLEQSIILSAPPDATAVAKYLLPYVGASIAEHFQEKGENILVVFDDLSNHADAYRELSLLIGIAPGREAYPGDIFYTHSRLLERAGKFTEQFGKGSITMIPIAQTLAGDISGYIPTNLISITDGQIYTSSAIFNEGRRPAIEITYSVSRLGSVVQKKAMTNSTKGLKRLISEYENIKRLSSFRSDVSSEDAKRISLGKAFEILINQEEYEVVDYNSSVILFQLLQSGVLSFYDLDSKDQLPIIKEVLKTFLTKDIIGMKLSNILNTHDVKGDVFQQYLKHIILPLLKYHILSENKWLHSNPKFIKVFKDIRNDGRVLLSYERRGYEKGIAYEI